MSQAYNTFMDSYFRSGGLKRPELFNFSPDQAFGANMVHGSERQNPWANRNQDNAKYGNLGGNNNKVVQGPEFTANPLAPGGFTQVANGPSASGQSGLNSIMGAITKPVGEYLGKTAYNWLNPESTLTDIGNKLGLAAGGEVNIPDIAGRLSEIGKDPLASLIPTAGDAFEGIGKEMTKGSTDMLKGAIEGGGSSLSFDPVSMGMSAIPALGRAFGLKGDVGNGLEAGASVGAAALQGGLNPIADIGAIMSLVKFFGGLFD
jgi:hypothetical protein